MLIVTISRQGNDDEDEDDTPYFSVQANVQGEIALARVLLAAVEERVRAEAPRREPGWSEDRLRKAMQEADIAIGAGFNVQARTMLADALRDTDDVPF